MNKIKMTLNYIIIVVACLIAIFPYILVFLASFNTSVDIKKGDILSNFSISTLFENWSKLIDDPSFLNSLGNSIIVSIGAVILGVLVASLAGYAYVVFYSKKMDRLFNISFFSILVPASVIVIPMFLILKKANMLDSLFSVILTSLSLPFLIYLFRQNTKLFPQELIRAARIDGLSEIGIFFRVYVPNMNSVFITAAIILFIDTWNSFLYPLTIIQSQRNMTLALYLNSIGSSYTSDYGAFMLALLLSTFPILLIFLLAQKYFRMGMKGL